MDFRRRLRLFLVGVLIGSLVVWGFLFKGRTFPAWTPEGRVLEALRENPIKVSAKARCLLDCNKISDDEVVHFLQNADVIFGESDIRGKDVPEYVLEGKSQTGKSYKMKFKSEFPATYLLTIIKTPDAANTCSCK